MVAFLTASNAAERPPNLLGINENDTRITINHTTFPWTSIGRVIVNQKTFCTGTLVREDVAITSAHCLWNKLTASWQKHHNINVLLGYQRGKYQQFFRVVAYKIGLKRGKLPTKYSLKELEGDWAILQLKPINQSKIRPILSDRNVILNQKFRESSKIAQAGFSSDIPHLLTANISCNVTNDVVNKKMFSHDCNATHGDSGSPIFVLRDAQLVLIGIHLAVLTKGGKDIGVALHLSAFPEF